MKDFWKFLNLFLSLMGFVLVAVLLLVNGDSFPDAVLRASISFAVMFVILNVFGSILTVVAGNISTESPDTEPIADESEVQQI